MRDEEEENNNNSERKKKRKKTRCDDDDETITINNRGFKKKKKKSSSLSPPPPIFAFKEQLSCSNFMLNKKCEACVRKVEKMRRECCSDGEDDVKKRSSSSKIVLKRPEECERFKRYHHHQEEEEEEQNARNKKQSVVGLYAKGDRILTVGDGDLTFSLSLAKRLKKVKLIATTHETRASLEKAYGKDAIKATLDELAICGEDVLVLHGVDAAKLKESLMDAAAVAASNKRDVLERVEKCIDEGFDKIVWNFPCVSREEDTGEAKDGAREGADGRNPADVELNRNLTLTFIANAAVMLRKKKSKKKRGAGEVHVTHKVGMPVLLERSRIENNHDNIFFFAPRESFEPSLPSSSTEWSISRTSLARRWSPKLLHRRRQDVHLLRIRRRRRRRRRENNFLSTVDETEEDPRKLTP